MSPPVLGTLLCLCIGYILPAADGKPPLSDGESPEAFQPLDSDSDVTIVRETGSGEPSKCDETVMLKATEGLCGVFCTVSSPGYVTWGSLKHLGEVQSESRLEGPSCFNCEGQFLNGECVYTWKDPAHPHTLYYHEACVLQAVQLNVCVSGALERVHDIQMNTSDEKLLASLFGLEDDLVHLDNAMLFPDGPSSRPEKIRRIEHLV